MTKNICFLLSLVLHLVLFVLVGGQSSDGCFCVERLGKSPLTDPVVLQKAGDGTDRLFVGELPGLIHVYYPNGEILPEPFIDVRPWMGQFPVTLDGHTHMIEFGLFGMALHPDFSENGLFYLHFTRENDEPGTDYLYKMRIGEFKVSTEDKNKADPSYFRLILDVRQSEMNHDGGQVILKALFRIVFKIFNIVPSFSSPMHANIMPHLGPSAYFSANKNLTKYMWVKSGLDPLHLGNY